MFPNVHKVHATSGQNPLRGPYSTPLCYWANLPFQVPTTSHSQVFSTFPISMAVYTSPLPGIPSSVKPHSTLQELL